MCMSRRHTYNKVKVTSREEAEVCSVLSLLTQRQRNKHGNEVTDEVERGVGDISSTQS